MLDDFLVRAALAGCGTALAAAPLGCFVLWRRMAFYGDATAHAALFGVALALAFGASVFLGTLIAALAMAVAVARLSRSGLSSDTALGVLSHAGLAGGRVAISLVPGRGVDLESYLFGDILAVSRSDLAVIWGGAVAVCALMAWRWSALLTATVDEDLAHAAGLAPAREQLAMTLALALTVAVAIKVVGVLLIAALLIVPAAAARYLARTPEAMALIAGLFGIAATAGGLAASLRLDTPAGPSIVAAATGIFILSGAVAPILPGRA